jgi:glycosyltransferase involved in cell wall biosynthesis
MEYNLATYAPGGAPKPAKFTFHAAPLVSCLMVTRGNEALMRQAIACFQAQTYGRRELVVVSESSKPYARDIVARLNDPNIRYVLGPDAPLGALRNASVAAARGDLVCQWDDDDLSDPQRLELTISAMAATRVDAVFLARVTLWWPERRRLALSEPRLWEGTMVALRGMVPPYPEYRRGEDSVMMDSLRARSRTAALDAPSAYVYRVTGQNTWDVAHFEALFARASEDLSAEHDAQTVGWPIPA